jgi:hypothetical protein
LILGLVGALSLYIFIKMLEGVKQELARKKEKVQSSKA